MVTTHNHHPTEHSRLLAIRMLFRLPLSQAILLDLLLDGEIISIDKAIEAGVAPTPGTARVVLHRLRNYLRDKDVGVQSLHNTGYWLEQAAREKLIEGLRPLLPAQVTGEARDVRHTG